MYTHTSSRLHRSCLHRGRLHRGCLHEHCTGVLGSPYGWHGCNDYPPEWALPASAAISHAHLCLLTCSGFMTDFLTLAQNQDPRQVFQKHSKGPPFDLQANERPASRRPPGPGRAHRPWRHSTLCSSKTGRCRAGHERTRGLPLRSQTG